MKLLTVLAVVVLVQVAYSAVIPVSEESIDCISDALAVAAADNDKYSDPLYLTIEMWTLLLTEANRCNADTEFFSRLECQCRWRQLALDKNREFVNYLHSTLDPPQVEFLLDLIHSSTAHCFGASNDDNDAAGQNSLFSKVFFDKPIAQN